MIDPKPSVGRDIFPMLGDQVHDRAVAFDPITHAHKPTGDNGLRPRITENSFISLLVDRTAHISALECHIR